VALRKRTQRQPRRDAPDSAGLTLRDEKILVMLAVQVQQLNDRLTRLEDRFEESRRETMTVTVPDQQDLLELRLHSARLAAELSRVAMELRAEINELAQNRGEIIDLTMIDELEGTDPSSHPGGGGPAHRRVDDPVLDVRDPAPPRPRPRRTSGWKPVRSSAPPETDD
jgi:hypothetical protein